MPEPGSRTEPAAVLRRLQDATNAHDIEAICACFAPGYRNETPAHPARAASPAAEQVRRNWTQILTSIPDLTAEVVESAVSGETVWSEWEHRGTRPDGTPHLMRGVIVFTVKDGLIASARFYLEPVDEATGMSTPRSRGRSARGQRLDDRTGGRGRGTGRLGTLVVRGLAARGMEVRVLTRDPRRAAHLAAGHVEVVTGDVRDRTSTAAAVAGAEVVVCAVQGLAGPGDGSPATGSTDGNMHLIQAARAAGARVVLMSVAGAAPDSPFELFRMKHAAETCLAASGVPATVVRAG